MQATTYAVVISGDCQVESFGARLKREREQRKITLDEISISTKIATRFLVALEEERFDQLPGGIFNKSFVKAYAHHLGIDEAQAVADYVAASGPVVPEANPEQSPHLDVLAGRVAEAPDSAGGIPWEMFAVGLLIVACAFALWGFYSREKPPRPRGGFSDPSRRIVKRPFSPCSWRARPKQPVKRHENCGRSWPP